MDDLILHCHPFPTYVQFPDNVIIALKNHLYQKIQLLRNSIRNNISKSKAKSKWLSGQVGQKNW